MTLSHEIKKRTISTPAYGAGEDTPGAHIILNL